MTAKPRFVSIDGRAKPWVSFKSLSFEEAGLSTFTHVEEFVFAPITIPVMISASGVPASFFNDYLLVGFLGYASGRERRY